MQQDRTEAIGYPATTMGNPFTITRIPALIIRNPTTMMRKYTKIVRNPTTKMNFNNEFQ
jgi:hypothetical protein